MPCFTRREILTAMLGAPVALAACMQSALPPLPAGTIVGGSVGIGHRLRDGWRITPAAKQWTNVDIVIIGGGIAGLSAAWQFHRAGFHDFILLELEPEIGGTSRSTPSPAISCPWGAHYLPVPMKENATLISLLDEMGILEGYTAEGEPIVAEHYLCRDPQERIFYRGRWYEGLYLAAGASAEDRTQFAAFHTEIDRWVAWRDAQGRRAFTIPIANSSDDPEVTALDRITMRDWLDQHGWTSSRLRWLVNYGCRDDYGLTIENTSAWAGIFYFASRIRQPGHIAQPLITWPEGNGRIVAHLYNRIRAKVRVGLAVTDVIPTESPQRSSVDVVAVDHDTQTALGFHARRVVFAAPQFLTRYLIRPYRDRSPSEFPVFEYGPWFVANLFLQNRPAERDFPLAWDNVLYDSPSLGYVVATHQRGLDHGPSIFTYYYPFCETDARAAREKLLAMDWRSCADVVLTDLRRAHPDIDSLVHRLDVMRWGHAMIRPRPGSVWSPTRRTAALPFRGIHFAHTDLSGVALFEEAFYHGVRAAEEVLAILRPS
ncbi:MAG: FAD-dependent oxidoreductase [Candidatus Binatia bacterium]